MYQFLIWLESTPLHDWIVESPSLLAFPGILALHAIGMGFAAGLGVAIDLRILGVAPAVPLREMRRLLPMLWAGFWLNAASGILLLIGYPTKALTNPVFYLKLGLIAIAMVLVWRIGRHLNQEDAGRPDRLRSQSELRRVSPEPLAKAEGRPLPGGPPGGSDDATATAIAWPAAAGLRRMAMVSLGCWAGAVTAGRLLAYTYRHLTATENISAMLHPGFAWPDHLWTGGLW